jgi:hypothetical protein
MSRCCVEALAPPIVRASGSIELARYKKIFKYFH